MNHVADTSIVVGEAVEAMNDIYGSAQGIGKIIRLSMASPFRPISGRDIKVLISASSTQVERGVNLVGQTGETFALIVRQVGHSDASKAALI